MAGFQLTRTAWDDVKAIGRTLLGAAVTRQLPDPTRPPISRPGRNARPLFTPATTSGPVCYHREAGGGIETLPILHERMNPDRHP
jgi:hypothetical protein